MSEFKREFSTIRDLSQLCVQRPLSSSVALSSEFVQCRAKFPVSASCRRLFSRITVKVLLKIGLSCWFLCYATSEQIATMEEVDLCLCYAALPNQRMETPQFIQVKRCIEVSISFVLLNWRCLGADISFSSFFKYHHFAIRLKRLLLMLFYLLEISYFWIQLFLLLSSPQPRCWI